MGTLKYAILGLLNRNEMTGYELSKEFETTLFEFWNAKHSQIYPELKSLTRGADPVSGGNHGKCAGEEGLYDHR